MELTTSYRKCATGLKALVALFALMTCCLGLSGCAGRQQAINSQDYVEIDNPFLGDSPDASPKIWVSKASLEKGVPRGRELIKKGYEKVTDAAVPPTQNLRLRLLVAESGRQLLTAPFTGAVGKALIVRQVARPAASEALTEQEALSYLAGLAADGASGPVLFLSKPEGTMPVARLKADLYDVRGPFLLRSFWVAVPGPENGQSEQELLQSAIKGLADTTVSILSWFPWYGKVVSVKDTSVYLDGGKETGLGVGQRVTVYRGGEVVKGLGFAPGRHIATLTVSDLFGSDGSIATSPEAANVQAGDYVELESKQQ